jgi:putative hydrolase of the HAD superfamily
MRAELPRFIRPDPVAESALQRWPCCVLTNGSDRLQRAKLAAITACVPTERVLVSGALGVAKPDVRAFRAAMALVGPSAVMIGDDPRADIAGAQAVGLETVWMRRGRTWPAERPLPTRIIDRLEDLL